MSHLDLDSTSDRYCTFLTHIRTHRKRDFRRQNVTETALGSVTVFYFHVTTVCGVSQFVTKGWQFYCYIIFWHNIMLTLIWDIKPDINYSKDNLINGTRYYYQF